MKRTVFNKTKKTFSIKWLLDSEKKTLENGIVPTYELAYAVDAVAYVVTCIISYAVAYTVIYYLAYAVAYAGVAYAGAYVIAYVVAYAVA